MNLGDVTDEDLIRNGLIDPNIRGAVMSFATQADLQEHREYEKRRAQAADTSRMYAAIDAFVLPPKPWEK